MFNYICQECGKGTVNEKVFDNYRTKIKGYPFVVDKAVIGVCDQCEAQHFNPSETKRWEELYNKYLESEHIFLSPDEIKATRKSLGLSMEDFAYFLGCTRQSIHNWEKRDRKTPQSRMADLLIRLVRYSSEIGKVDVINFLRDEAKKLGLNLEAKGENQVPQANNVIQLTVKRVPENYFQESKENAELAAASGERKEITIAETQDQGLIGIIRYDYETADLFLEIKKDKLRLKEVDVEFTTNDDKSHTMKNVEVKDNRVFLLPETEYTENSVKEIFLKLKS
ncbi:MAG: type II TA system antitoxin MqsA family protein [Thermodesulfobacteriota bacterium]